MAAGPLTGQCPVSYVVAVPAVAGELKAGDCIVVPEVVVTIRVITRLVS